MLNRYLLIIAAMALLTAARPPSKGELKSETGSIGTAGSASAEDTLEDGDDVADSLRGRNPKLWLLTTPHWLTTRTTTKSSFHDHNAPKFKWGYKGNQGPEFWGSVHPTCLGSAQSPINIDTKQVEVQANVVDKLRFVGYDLDEDTTEYNLKNNGHSVELEIVSSLARKPTMHGGHLTSEYEFAQLHFHWGPHNDIGSEHTVDGVAYPMEVHLVHVAKTIARQEFGGLAVAGFMFDISAQDNPDIEPLIRGISRIKKKGQDTRLEKGFILSSLISSSSSGPYWTYEGSLTTPGCDEVVQWNLFKIPLKISSSQLSRFCSILDSEGQPVLWNFRPVQPGNGRTVKYWD